MESINIFSGHKCDYTIENYSKSSMCATSGCKNNTSHLSCFSAMPVKGANLCTRCYRKFCYETGFNSRLYLCLNYELYRRGFIPEKASIRAIACVAKEIDMIHPKDVRDIISQNLKTKRLQAEMFDNIERMRDIERYICAMNNVNNLIFGRAIGTTPPDSFHFNILAHLKNVYDASKNEAMNIIGNVKKRTREEIDEVNKERSPKIIKARQS